MSETVPQPPARHAWRELDREGQPKRSAKERLSDFLEIHGLFDEATARKQASRCIQCPNPSCVSGCPLCNPIPQWMQLTAEGRFLEAAAVLGSTGGLADICSRLCPADQLCEHTCILDGVSEPVSIAGLERFLADYAARHETEHPVTAPPNGWRVAVVGSGPGGLACADELARQGCAVTIFDDEMVPGGLLIKGVPAFKLEHSILERRINLMKQRGVKFHLGTEPLGDGVLTRLRNEFDAVFLGFDSREARPLSIPGSDLSGVIQAVPFILQKRTSVELSAPELALADKRVAVIGGGDTALDCLRTAVRWGAREALCVYRRGEADLPCSRASYQEAIEEGVRFLFHALPLAVLGSSRGDVPGLRLTQTAAGDREPDGRHAFKVLPDTEFSLAAEVVVAALGFEPKPCLHKGDLAELSVNEWGGLMVDESLMTNIPGVFAGGDIVRGPALVLITVRDGRRAADGILAYLRKPAR